MNNNTPQEKPATTPAGGELAVRGESSRALTHAQFHQLSEVPAAAVWLANIDNENTRRAYKGDVEAFIGFCGIEHADELRQVTRAHVIAWRELLESEQLAPATVRRKLSAVSSLYDYLCNENAVESNPVAGVKRPTEGANEGKTPALSDEQARMLLKALRGTHSKPGETGRSWRPICSMRCDDRRSLTCGSSICASDAGSCTSRCLARGRRRGSCRCILRHCRQSKSI